MRLWTIQPQEIYEILKQDGVFHCDPSRSTCLTEMNFGHAYDWMCEQMYQKIGNPPEGVTSPIWAWHTLDWKHQKPYLRRTEFCHEPENSVCLEVEIPDAQVLLSDEERWHSVLGNWYLTNTTNETDYRQAEAWFDSLSPEEQQEARQQSWQHIFEITPFENEWDRRGCYIQATFWELRLEQIISVRYFKGRWRKK